jgi:hypothetical protein
MKPRLPGATTRHWAEGDGVVKKSNLYPFVLACLMFVISFQLFTQHVLWFGFRDKFASELDVAEHALAIALIWFSIAVGVLFSALGFLSFRIDIRKPLAYGCILFLIVAAISAGIDMHFRSYMADSSGG